MARQPALVVPRQVGRGEHRVRLDARRPHEGLGIEFVAVATARRARRRPTPAGWRGARRCCARRAGRPCTPRGRTETSGMIRVAASTSTQRMSDGRCRRRTATRNAPCPRARQSPRRRRSRRRRTRSVSARASLLRIGHRRSQVEPGQHVVAQVDRLADRLEADAVLGQPRDRQDPRDRARADDEHVVSDLVCLALGGQHGGQLARVLDASDGAGDHPAASRTLRSGTTTCRGSS